MVNLDIINTFAKMFLISFFIYLTYGKISNYKNSNVNYILIFFISNLISIFYIILNQYLLPLISIVILYMIYGIIIDKIIKTKMNYFAYLFSCVIAYVTYLITIVISGLILLLFLDQIEYSNPVSLITIPIIYSLLFWVVFSRKRFKNGVNFLKNKEINNNTRNFMISFVGIIIFIFGLLQRQNDMVFKRYLLIGSVFIVFGVAFWIKSQITKTYKSNMRDRTIEIQKNEIDEKDKIIEELKSENLKLATAIHKYNHKFSSLESAMKNAIDIENKTEFADEISIILRETSDTIENFSKEVYVNKNKLPLTNIKGIDNMFKYMQEEAIKNNINLDLKINESINYLIENIIPKEKFEILIGDHLKDAIIAIKSSNNSYKSILVTLGLVENCYELTIYDTGIEFEVDTLVKLGKEQVTTHKETGGSGIGFMTTFETIKNCKASLIIEEYKPETTNYTKAVIIRFDNKNEYKIISYRADEIKKLKNGRKIKIQNIY